MISASLLAGIVMCLNASNEFTAYEILSESGCILGGDSVKSECILPSVAVQKFLNFPFRYGPNMIVPDIPT